MRTMNNRELSPLLVKWVFLVAWWVCVAIMMVFCIDNGSKEASKRSTNNLDPFIGHKNEIGAFAIRHWDPEGNYRPVYSVAFNNLYAENGSLGIYKTALHKVVTIEDLQGKFFQYSTDGCFGSAQTIPLTTFSNLLGSEDNKNDETIIDKILGKLKDKKGDWPFSIDFSNISEVRIKNLDYKIFDNGVLLLGVQCKRANVSYRSPEIILRGHVTLTTASGSTLESNRIRWDTKKHRFIADRRYILNRNGRKTTGKGICVDAQLNTIQSLKVSAKGEQNG